jgi:2-oxoisovalerate dehydrogenase E2 component (dihydrolipoyl transacylase)
MAQYLLPDVGEGLTEADIVSWRVSVGDTVAINDIVVEIETAKSLVELPSPYAGVVSALLVPEGQTVNVGTPIIEIVEVGSAATHRAPTPTTGGAAAPGEPVESAAAETPGSAANLVGYGPKEAAVHRRPRHASATSLVGAGSARALAKPPVRLLARELGVDLGSVPATGDRGDVTRADLEAAAGSATPALTPAATYDVTSGRERVEPIKGLRKAMAAAMVESAFTAPHVSAWVTVDVTRTMELVERLKTEDAFSGVRVSPLLILARACIVAMRRTPEINSRWDAEAGVVVYKRYVNLGIAAATPRGLVVPNVKDAQDLTLPELGAALNQLAATAREGRTAPEEMRGGTFTITNVGVFGVDGGTPIINPGEAAILAFGAVTKQPWVVSTAGGDALAIRQVCTLALSFDHRQIDGALGCRFLGDVAALLQDPSSLLD